MANNNLNVLFGDGAGVIDANTGNYLNSNNTLVLKNDVEAFRSYNGDGNIWALFCDMNMPYDLDRNNAQIPSLAEMSKKAIDILSKNENGFFLMIGQSG